MPARLMCHLRLVAFIVGLLGTGLLAGCKGSCQRLSELSCQCSLNPSDRSTCLSLIGQAQNAYGTSPADETRCDALLEAKKCDCHLIDTPEGKKACGMAR